MMVDGASPPEAGVDSFRRTYETNVFGVLAVTNAFLPALRRSAAPRIVNISSGTGSLTVSSSATSSFSPGGGAAYRSSKTALNALTLFYAQALAGEGFKVNALAPGLRRTDLNERAAASDGDPAEAAAGAVRLALLGDDGPTGEFRSWDLTERALVGQPASGQLPPLIQPSSPVQKSRFCGHWPAPPRPVRESGALTPAGRRPDQMGIADGGTR